MKPASFAKDFAAIVRAALAEKGWTAARLATEMKVLPPHISRMLAGTAPPSGTTVEKVAAAFGLSVRELLCEKRGRKKT